MEVAKIARWNNAHFLNTTTNIKEPLLHPPPPMWENPNHAYNCLPIVGSITPNFPQTVSSRYKLGRVTYLICLLLLLVKTRCLVKRWPKLLPHRRETVCGVWLPTRMLAIRMCVLLRICFNSCVQSCYS